MVEIPTKNIYNNTRAFPSKPVDFDQVEMKCLEDDTQRGNIVTTNTIKEGSIYKVLTAFGKKFEIRYGYYEDFERLTGEPVPIYPDFTKHSLYTEDGFPYVTQMQDACRHCRLRSRDNCCGNCLDFVIGEELIGICKNENNRK